MMDHLPLGDAMMLASAINCLLRDREFDSLDDLCSYYDVDRSEIERIITDAGLVFDEEKNRIG